MSEAKDKDCHCFTCDKDFHHLGIARHRAMHREKGEPCRIEFSDGSIRRYAYGEKQEASA